MPLRTHYMFIAAYLVEGIKLKREWWKNSYIELRQGVVHRIYKPPPDSANKETDTEFKASQDDMQAQDWMIVE